MSRYTDYFDNNITEEHCVMFDQTYSVPPTTTGSYSGSQNWTATVINTPITSNADSFMPGQRSWRFRIDTQSNYGNRLRNNNSSFMALVSDNSYSAGVWFRSGTLPSATGAAAVCWAMRPASRGFFVSIYKNQVTGDPQYGKNQISITVGDKLVTFENDNYPTIDSNVWNYVAIRRDGANGYIYLNGEEVWSSSSIAINTTASMVGYDFGNVSTTWNQDIDFAGAYIAGYNDVTATEISNLWLYGSPTNRISGTLSDIKYYDGDSWEPSTDQKVYHSGGWQDVYASRWNGSAWIPV